MSKSFYNDLRGQRFGNLTVLEFVPNNKNTSYWKCKCDCGKIVTVVGANLNNGTTKSCGCLSAEIARELHIKHRGARTRLYRTWISMKQRCYDVNATYYDNYGGRGIRVCDEWKNDFDSFRDWALANGYNDNLSIDRIDVNGNYAPSNCRWADRKMQNWNKRNNIFVEFQGEKITLVELSEKTGINVNALRKRYRKGDRDERLCRPVKN